jgi:murein DD-endopeptidase MepM/ murein hydrolase activator NlpD
MKIVRLVRVVCLAVLVSVPVLWLQFGPEPLVDLVRYVTGSPHDRYAVSLKWGQAAGSDAARAWLEAAETAVASPIRLNRSHYTFQFDADVPAAGAVAITLRRGQRYVVETQFDGAIREPVFIDVLRLEGAAAASVANVTETGGPIDVEIDADGEYIVRVQPALHAEADVTLTLRVEPTLRVPVEKATRRSIGSLYGDPRDGGRRDHHGVDIFARRGTPVVAAAGGIVTRVGTNGLGGNVVWIARPMRGEVHYYAHLDRQLVTVGTRVEKGDVIGVVGNTGNARSTPPHLHFGIYTSGGPVDPLPYISS